MTDDGAGNLTAVSDPQAGAQFSFTNTYSVDPAGPEDPTDPGTGDTGTGDTGASDGGDGSSADTGSSSDTLPTTGDYLPMAAAGAAALAAVLMAGGIVLRHRR